MGKRCLVALDTDHIKQYVFATDRLKEIRGASSILDNLNRRVMQHIADDPAYGARPVYANGGSGLFLLERDHQTADQFGRDIQQAYHEQTAGGASITYVVEDIPDSVGDPWTTPMPNTLELLRVRLAQQKLCPPDHIALASHPLLRTCDACGRHYAEELDDKEQPDPRGRLRRYCAVCMGKRAADEHAKGEDEHARGGLRQIIRERNRTGNVTANNAHPFIWETVIRKLPEAYKIPDDTVRPEDFDALGTSEAKGYLALIYADGNNMGQMMNGLTTLKDIHDQAKIIDDAVYAALVAAISAHLPVPDEKHTFPFDILMIGGDDIMLATSAAAALDVACTLATTFYQETSQHSPDGIARSLSVGIVLAPVKYPFGPLHDLAESTLRFAKKAAARRQPSQAATSDFGDTLLNFITVTGSTSPTFERVYAGLHTRGVPGLGRDANALYATLRPYTVEDMQALIGLIRRGKQPPLALYRTKLHQIREAVQRMNLSTSVYEGMAVLRNWRSDQRAFVLSQVYPLGQRQPDAPVARGTFPRVTFPWYADGEATYRTALLDYVELYDYLPLKEEKEDA